MESTPVATNEHQPIRYHFITARQRICGKVMFSVVCGCQSVFPQGVQCHHYPSCIGPHCTETPQPPPPGHRTSPYRDPSLRHGTSLYRDSPPQALAPTCSLDYPPPDADIWWAPEHVRSASGRYTSYWNALSWTCCCFQLGTWESLQKI